MKPVPKLQLVASSDRTSKEAVIDEFGELERKVKAFQPIATRHKLLREQIAAWFPELPGDQAAVVSGHLYDVQIGERHEERTIISMAKVFKAIGKLKFLAVCALTLKSLEEALGKDKASEYLRIDRTGFRKITAVAKSSPAAA